ncbi:MAG: IclR family transcriptional regulator, partial [Egibacteraceae bacterium]
MSETNSQQQAVAPDGHRTVGRIAAILEFAAADAGGVRLGEVAARLDAPKSSVHGLLRGLVAVGYLVERGGRYMIGPGIAALLAPFHQRSLADVARRELERLSAATGETVLLGTRVGNNIVYLDQVESRHTIRYAAHLRERRPLFHTSMGKIFLADMEPRARERLLRRGRREEIGDLDGLLAELETVRREQVAYNREETVARVAAAASGVRDNTGTLVAAVSVAGPSYRMVEVLADIGGQVRATAV